MRLARSTLLPEFLQWFGLLAAALAWTGQLVLGFGVTDAACSAGSARWGIDVHTWEIVLLVAGAGAAVVAEAAALVLFLDTRGTGEDDPPPWGRRHFFASAALVGNALFLTVILLSGLATLAHSPCTQS
jgi:hypothetical protein